MNTAVTEKIADKTDRHSTRFCPVDFQDTVTEEPNLSELALKLFGAKGGVELELPRHPPHQPLEFDP